MVTTAAYIPSSVLHMKPMGPDGYLNLEDEEIRKIYTRLASRVHPDKLHGFADAKAAFQALVRAYELCCKPGLRAEDSEDSRESDS